MIATTTSMMKNTVHFKMMMFVLCVVLEVVYGEEEVRCIPKEREALLQFKAALVLHNGMLSSWTTPHCCQWEGIRCSNRTSHILSLDLHGDFYNEISRRYISGEIHKSLMELRQLKYLNLNFNSFPDSHIPVFLGSLRNLRYLDLSSCYFGGKIPAQFGSLSHLKYLNLARNNLEGSIPSQLGNLSQLHFLDLRGYFSEGNIPSQLGNLSQLQELYLEGFEGALKIDDGGQWLSNLFSLTHLYLGSVSNLNHSHSWLHVIAKLPKLRELSLVYCSLSDHFILSSRPSKFNFSDSLSILDLSWNTFNSPMIFHWVSNISSNLVELDLSHNLLEGSTSSHLVMNSNLVELDLSHNLLEGSTSSHLVMNSLRHLDLSCNRFKGEDLKSFMNISTLHSLDMSGNNLTEDLPSILHNLSSGCFRQSLQELYLSYNHITGTLSDVSIFSSLKILDLSENQLSGKIHESVKLPSHLESLSIGSNLLEGGIPKSFGNLCALRSLDMSYNSLSEKFPIIMLHLSGCTRYSLQKLNLRENKINGTLPNLSIFSNLQVLDLSYNQLSGKIPKGIQLPSHLKYLSIGSNSFEDGIPKSFGNACCLQLLDMSNNSFSGDFPMVIHHLSGCAKYSLKYLDLSMNKFNGTLPDLSTFTSLQSLYLYENKLNAEIPEDIQFPPQLVDLYMQSNSLKGVLTDYHFANMSELQILDLSDNSLTLAFAQNWVPPFQLRMIGLRSCKLGPTFPKWLQTQNEFEDIDISNATISDIVPEWFWAKLPLRGEWNSLNISYNNLRGIIPNLPLKNPSFSLILRSNQFEGPIPLFLRNSVSLDLSRNKFSSSHSFLCANSTTQILYQLDLSNNQLFGQIPDCWNHLNSLAYLDLSHNNFSGKIPISMGLLLDLQALLLRNNNLVEEIPFSLRNCTKLVMLDLAQNKLSGPIPDWIGEKNELQILSLERNQFYGNLPLQICCLRNIQVFDLSLNKLSGKIPKCIKNFTSIAETTSSMNQRGHWYFLNTSVNTSGVTGNLSYDLNALLMWKGSEQMFNNKGLLLLKSIDLSSNHFSEEIPKEIEELSGLISLNLSRNNLSGKIPPNIGKLASLESLGDMPISSS